MLYTGRLALLHSLSLILLIFALIVSGRNDILFHWVIATLSANRGNTGVVHIHSLATFSIRQQTIVVVVTPVGQVNSPDKRQSFIHNHTFLVMRKHNPGFRPRALDIKYPAIQMAVHRRKYTFRCSRIGFHL